MALVCAMRRGRRLLDEQERTATRRFHVELRCVLLRRNLPHDHPVWHWIICPHEGAHQPNPQQQYLEDGGTTCPHCGSTAIQASALEPDGMTADQMVDCHDCHATWFDEFRLTGFRDLQPPKTEPEEDEEIALFHSENHED